MFRAFGRKFKRLQDLQEELFFLIYLKEALKYTNLKSALKFYWGGLKAPVARFLGLVEKNVPLSEAIKVLPEGVSEAVKALWLGVEPGGYLEKLIDIKEVELEEKLAERQAVFSVLTVFFTVSVAVLPVIGSFLGSKELQLLSYILPAMAVIIWKITE